MINNIEILKPHLQFFNERSFYFIQIIKRKKENPDMKSYTRPIESFYVFSLEQLDRMMPHIIEKCEQNRARAYIKMNTLDAQDVGLTAIRVISEQIAGKDWKAMQSNFNMACGRCGRQEGEDLLYLVDIDSDCPYNKEDVRNYINQLQPTVEKGGPEDKVVVEVPTRNGIHFITTGFEINLFKNKFPGIDVHKDGITLLYFPECCG